MTYRDAYKFLCSLERFGIKLGLRNIEELCRSLGDPQNQFSAVHVAGTNGKGSTSSFVAAIAQAAGYKVGLYTSPHLVDFRERIRINGVPISAKRVGYYTGKLVQKVRELRATFFEATTAIAFAYFADEKVDLAVIETGLGGRLDATNIISPMLSIITHISFDHTEQLGNKLRSIAREKGGIIKPRTPVVIGRSDLQVEQELVRIAKRRGSDLYMLRSVCIEPAAGVASYKEWRNVADVETKDYRYRRLIIGLGGGFQLENAALAIRAAEILRGCRTSTGKVLRFPAKAIREGIKDVRKLTGIRGRFEVHRFNQRSVVIFDVAHNPDGIAAMLKSFDKLRIPREGRLILFGVMKDKDYQSMIRSLVRNAGYICAVAPKTDRALSPGQIQTFVQKLSPREKIQCDVARGVADGMRKCLRRLSYLNGDGALVVTGSHYVVGEAIPVFERAKLFET